jgi:hypothetical protein
MAFLLIRHEVKDFDRWKPLYDGHRGARQAAGLHELHLFRDAEQPNRVTALFRADDVAKAKAFGSSPDLAAKMREAGVVGQPDVSVLNEA